MAETLISYPSIQGEKYIDIVLKDSFAQMYSPAFRPFLPSYLDWTMYTRRLLYDHGQKKKQLEYWNEMLKDLPVLDMPLDHMRPLVLSSKGARIPVAIPKNLVLPFTDLMAEANSNLFVGLLSLYMSLLYVWGGGDKFRYIREYIPIARHSCLIKYYAQLT